MKRILYARVLRWALLNGVTLLVLMTALRFGFTWRFHPVGFSWKQSLPAFWLGFRFDLRIVCIVTLLIWLLAAVSYFNPFKHTAAKKFWLGFMGVVTLVFCIFYGSDFAHYAYLTQRLNASVINYTEDVAISAKMVWQTYPVVRILLLLFVAVYGMMWLARRYYHWAAVEIQPVSRAAKIMTSVLVFLLLGMGIFGKVGQYPLRWSDAFTLGHDFNSNIALNPFQSFFSTLKFRNSTRVDETKTKAYYPLIADYLGIENKQPLQYDRYAPAVDSQAQRKMNVVLVICESFSAYKSSMWGNPLNTTPFFQQLCNEGVFFNQCFTPAYGTAKGVWASITGIPDVTTSKTASRNMAMVNQQTIINDFKGYEKFYFLGGSTSWANIRGLLVNNIEGLQLYEEGSFVSPREDVWGISDKNLFLESHEVLKKQTAPFFAVIQTAGNHRPYTIPEEDLDEFKKVEYPVDSLRNNGFDNNDELNAFRYSDFCIQKFMDAASKEKYFNNTLFVFIGDHGILGRPGPPFNKTWIEGDLTREHVPLLFYAPGFLQPKTHNAVCSQVDLLPTIAAITGTAYHNTTLGRNILSPAYLADTSLLKQNAFRFNAETNKASLVMNRYYYELHMTDGKERLFYLHSDEAVPVTAQTEQVKKQAKELTQAIWETSRYMLLHNKRKEGSPAR